MEEVDIYDEKRQKTGRTFFRGRDFLKPDEYFIAVDALIINSEGKILIGKRSETRNRFPGYWEINGGSSKKGETSEEAVVREIHEELGIDLDITKGKLLRTVIVPNKFKDIWTFNIDIDANDLNFNDGEVADAKWVTIDEFIELRENDKLVDFNNICKEDIEKAKELLNMN